MFRGKKKAKKVRLVGKLCVASYHCFQRREKANPQNITIFCPGGYGASECSYQNMILCTTLRGDVPVPYDYVTFDPRSVLDLGAQMGDDLCSYPVKPRRP